ncbi:MAG: SusE domain-containing protein [Muribaculaceae bacterium]|nr:SusE domain-containing protein [Muribaculaceae bacterium]
MKKISIFLAFLVAICTLSSCVDTREPILSTPTAFNLNTPALSEQLYVLSESGTIELTWSQPDYGYAAIANYTVDVSIKADFSEFEALDGTYTTCVADVKQSDIAEAICKLQGYTKDNADTYVETEPAPVYFRVNSSLKGVDNTAITSNIISLKKVKGYKAIQSPGFIYLVGKPEGWAGPTASSAEHYAEWRLFEADDAIGSKIYTGVFNIKADDATFRFYTALTGWDADSYGIQVDDNPMDITLEDDVYVGDLVKGKGSFNIPDWTEDAALKITVNMSTEGKFSVKFEKGGVDVSGKKYIYLVGAPEGWAGPDAVNEAHYADWKLYDMGDNGIYTGKFTIPADKFEFRFYKALTGWDGGDSLGSQADDAATEIEWEEGSAMSSIANPGKGAWKDPTWTTEGKVSVEVNLTEGIISFKKL